MVKIKRRITAPVSPVWMVFISFTVMLAAIALANYRRFSFRGLNFFTLLWILCALAATQAVLSAREFIAGDRSGRWRQAVASFSAAMFSYLPYLLMAMLYDNIGLFHAAVSPAFNDMDYRLLRLDEIIFGVQPTISLERFLNPLLVEYSMAAYSLFLLPFLFLFFIYQKGERPVFDRLILSQVICAAIALTCFIYLPARGPRYVFDQARGGRDAELPRYGRSIEGVRIEPLYRATGVDSLFRFQYDGWNTLERVKTDCMPSMHTTLYVLCLIFVIRYRGIFKWRRLTLWFWSISCISLIFSCVYLRYHWVMDIVAGIVLAIAAFCAADWTIGRRGTPRSGEPGTIRQT